MRIIFAYCKATHAEVISHQRPLLEIIERPFTLVPTSILQERVRKMLIIALYYQKFQMHLHKQ